MSFMKLRRLQEQPSKSIHSAKDLPVHLVIQCWYQMRGIRSLLKKSWSRKISNGKKYNQSHLHGYGNRFTNTFQTRIFCTICCLSYFSPGVQLSVLLPSRHFLVQKLGKKQKELCMM
jgi:hypothetical protein